LSRGSEPSLRFPEFNQPWEEKLLGSICIVKTGNKDTQDRIDSGKYPFYVRSNTIERIDSYSFDGEAILTSGDGVGVGKNYHYVNGKFDYHQRVYALHSFQNNISGKFVYHIFTEKFYRRVMRLSAKNSVDSVRMSMITEMQLRFPSLPEQQKIAAFLSAVDKKIQLLQRKKELLEQYKKGVMQKIFSQEIRFKDDDGNEYPDWEEKRLGEIITEHRGGASLRPSDFVNVPCFEVIPKKAISKGGVLMLDVENPTYCSESFFNSNEMNVIDDSYVITTLRDLVPSGPNIGYVVKYMGESRYILAQGVYAFKIDTSLSIPDFLIQFSNTSTYRKIMQEIMVGSTQVHIRNRDYFKVPIAVPSIAEQLRITAFLNSIDKKIESLRDANNENRRFKEGLLQQMFV